ncbi:MAG: hypothetical protein ABI366_09110 [Ginsengibacter sp.]
MKEITINIPDESSELLIELVERLGGCVDKKKKITKERVNIKSKPKKNIGQSDKTKKEKIDHTWLFGKWKDFDIDAKKLREESW